MSEPTDTEGDIGYASTSVGKSRPTVQPGAFEPPPNLGPFELDSILGRGGMAAVYLAKQRGSAVPVALKLMDPNLRADPSFVERFMNEAKASAGLRHPNIVEVVAHGESSGWYFIACEFVTGGTVASLIKNMGVLPTPVAAELMAQLLAGLAHAHQAGVVHRDLKPENLLLTQEGVLKLADFGIARSADAAHLTKTGMLVGTAGYMSPEQAKGLRVDSRSDLFTSGVILYEFLTGVNPYMSDNPATSITRILSSAAPPIFEVRPSAPPEMEAMLDSLLAFNPDERFQSAAMALESLLPFVEGRRRSEPDLIAKCLADPAGMRARLDREAANAMVQESKRLVSGNDVDKNRAILKLFLARELDPTNVEAQALFAQMQAVMPVTFGPPANPKILELEQALAGTPNAPAILQQLAQLYRLEGNVFKAAVYVKRYLRVKPGDAYAANQLFQITGEKARPPTSVGRAPGKLGPATAELVAGIKTGGFKAQVPATQQHAAGTPTRQIAAPTANQSQPNLGRLSLPEVEAKNPLVGQLVKLGVVLAVVGGVYFGFKKVSAGIDNVAKEQEKQSAEMRRQMQADENAKMAAEAKAEEQRLDEERGVEATAKLNDALSIKKTGNVAGALNAFDSIIREYPKRPQATAARFQRGLCLLELGRNSEAKSAFSEFLEKHPSDEHAAEALLRRGQALLKNLLMAEALADLDAFLQNHSGSALVTEAFFTRGDIRSKMGDTTGARADFDAVLARVGVDDPLRAKTNDAISKLAK